LGGNKNCAGIADYSIKSRTCEAQRRFCFISEYYFGSVPWLQRERERRTLSEDGENKRGVHQPGQRERDEPIECEIGRTIFICPVLGM
jgi:hypothetical protein